MQARGAMVFATLWTNRGETRKLKICSAQLHSAIATPHRLLLTITKFFFSVNDGDRQKGEDERSFQGAPRTLYGPRHWLTRLAGWMWRNSTNCNGSRCMEGGPADCADTFATNSRPGRALQLGTATPANRTATREVSASVGLGCQRYLTRPNRRVDTKQRVEPTTKYETRTSRGNI